MDEISVKGKKYLKAKLIARELGYTSDYVGQLCRGGKVDAELVGRTWYVDPDSIKGHRDSRYRSAKASTKRELKTDVMKALQTEEALTREHFYKHKKNLNDSQIQYETDESDLIPVTKKSVDDSQQSKVKLEIGLADAKDLEIETDDEKKYHFEAPEREETKFFGTLKVTDFITEVTVGGDDEEPKTVPVSGLERQKVKKNIPDEVKIKSPTLKKALKESKIQDVVSTQEKMGHVTENSGQKTSIAIPVQVDEVVVALPLRYHVVTAVSFVTALMLAAVIVGLEATVITDKEVLNTEYVFAVENLSALVFVIK